MFQSGTYFTAIACAIAWKATIRIHFARVSRPISTVKR